ncbi:MAG: GLUG motif-containing protein [Planctomycetota bacterium]
MKRKKRLFFVLFSLLTTSFVLANNYYTVIDLGPLDNYSPMGEPKSINDNGQIVGYFKTGCRAGGCLEASIFNIYKDNIYLGSLDGSPGAEAFSNNESSQIVGWAYTNACLFDSTGNGNNVDLGTLGGDFSAAVSINDKGQIVGGSDSDSETHACLFDPTGAGNNIDLGTLGGEYSTAYSINNNGQIVGTAGYDPNNRWNQHACLFDPTGNGSNIDLGSWDGESSGAMCINDLGQIVGWYGKDGYRGRACLFDSTGAGNNVDLGILGGDYSAALSINDKGQIVGWAENDSGIPESVGFACLFDSTGEGNNINLNTLIDPASGWVLYKATAINNHGWIVGHGGNKDPDVSSAFLLIPEDSGLAVSKYSGGDGSPQNPYRISTPFDLDEIESHPEDWNKHFIMTDNIDTSVFNINNYNTLDTWLIDPFTGVFDGNNLSITNLESSLFGRVADPNAEIKNLTLNNPFLSGNSHPMGALVEYLEDGTIDNCHVQDANISGCREVGGLVGRNEYGIISNSSADVDFGSFGCGRGGGGSGGGIAGYNLYGDILNCRTNVTAKEGVSAVGIAYENHGNISNCASSIDNGIGLVRYNTGMIENSSAKCTAGQDGLVTHNEGQIINCSTSGDIYGKQAYHGYRSGLVGYNEGYISGCTSTCDIYIEESGIWIGGIVSYNSFGDVNDCHYEGTITVGEDSEFVGGLVGQNYYGNIKKSFATGTISGEVGSYVFGGLVGYNFGGSIETSYSMCFIQGYDAVGGLLGINHYGEFIKNCYSLSTVLGNSNIGGLIGNNTAPAVPAYLRTYTTNISNCYVASPVSGDMYVGSFVGYDDSIYIYQNCFYDSETNPLLNGIGNHDEPNVIGLPITDMQTRSTFTDAGWDFVFETDNGTEDIWMINEHHDYPKFTYQNIIPVAVPGPNQSVGIWPGDDYAEVLLDGLNSFDPDGDSNNLTYNWSWTIDSNDYNYTEPIFLTDLPVGLCTFELIVSDDINDSEPNTCDINVIAPLKADVRITPRTINRKAKGPKRIRAIFSIPAGIEAEDMLNEPLLLLYTGGGSLLQASNQIIVKSRKGTLRCLASFNRDEFLDAISDNGQIELNVVATLKTGQYIYATDSIKIK